VSVHVVCVRVLWWGNQVEEHTFTAGRTASLVGYKVVDILSAATSSEALAASTGVPGAHTSSSKRDRGASLLVVDRTLDLACATAHNDNVMELVMATLGSSRHTQTPRCGGSALSDSFTASTGDHAAASRVAASSQSTALATSLLRGALVPERPLLPQRGGAGEVSRAGQAAEAGGAGGGGDGDGDGDEDEDGAGAGAGAAADGGGASGEGSREGGGEGGGGGEGEGGGGGGGVETGRAAERHDGGSESKGSEGGTRVLEGQAAVFGRRAVRALVSSGLPITPRVCASLHDEAVGYSDFVVDMVTLPRQRMLGACCG